MFRAIATVGIAPAQGVLSAEITVKRAEREASIRSEGRRAGKNLGGRRGEWPSWAALQPRPAHVRVASCPTARYRVIRCNDMTASNSKRSDLSPQQAGARPREQRDWREDALSRIRVLIKQADHDAVEERKWVKPTNPAGVPVWSDHGLICTGEIYKDHVKLTFAKGASLEDPARLFTSSLEGKVRRAIDIYEGEKVDERAFKALIRAAVALNKASVRRK